MSDLCPECSAALPPSGSCRDNCHSLLALEWNLQDAAGGIAHFYAVSSYVLQHPDSMNYTTESLSWLRSAVASALAGTASVDDLRQSARRHGKPSGRVTRRPGDPVKRWAVRQWHTRVTDVLGGGVDGSCQRVEDWARSVIDDLAASDA